MNFRGMTHSDMVIIDTMLAAVDPMNIREISEATGIGYNTCRIKVNDHIRLGLYRKVPNSGGRFAKNDGYEVIKHFESIRAAPQYIPPVEDPKVGSRGIVLEEVMPEQYGDRGPRLIESGF